MHREICSGMWKFASIIPVKETLLRSVLSLVHNPCEFRRIDDVMAFPSRL
jgi:hypothetical protein